MRRVVSVVVLAVLLFCAGSEAAAAKNKPSCDFTGAVAMCSRTPMTRCAHFRCLAEACPSDVAAVLAHGACNREDAATAMPAVTEAAPQQHVRDGDDSKHVSARGASAGRRGADASSLLSTPRVNSPCLNATADWDQSVIRALLYSFAMDVYAGRFNETYSENMTLRWVGINDRVCPPAVPRYSDCSSTVTWIYWTLFGNGPDFMNQESWTGGYTGSLKANGVEVSTDQSSLQVGDLCFYYHPMHHVAIYVGNGMVVTHGMDPVGYYSYTYAPLDYCRRYL